MSNSRKLFDEFKRLNKRFETGFTLTELAFIVVIICIFTFLLAPFINKIRDRARIVTCEENLEKIGLGLKLYANEHREAFPLSLDELVKGGYVEDKKIFDCPSSPHVGDAKESDYNYNTGYTILSPSDKIIVSDKIENHKGKRHVLYVSGEIAWLASEPVSQ